MAQGLARRRAPCSSRHFHLPLPTLPQAALLGSISSLEPFSLGVGRGEVHGYTGPVLLPLRGLADRVEAAFSHQGPSASLAGPHRCAWNGSARQRVWSKCAASWTRRPSGTSGTSRTPEGPAPPTLGGDRLSPLLNREAEALGVSGWSLHPLQAWG